MERSRAAVAGATITMQFKDYYDILGVEPSAGDAEIKTAYRRLARKYHPDVSKEAGAEEQFKAVNEAYEALRDPQKRAAYDQLRTRGYRPGDEVQPPPGGYGYGHGGAPRSEEPTSERPSLMRISYAVFCLKTKKDNNKMTKPHIAINTSKETLHYNK